MENQNVPIKIEGNQDSVTELQTYHETFKKEFNDRHGEISQLAQLERVEGLTGDDDGVYFVDQKGQYYYQAYGEKTPVLAQVPIKEVVDAKNNDNNDNNDNSYQKMKELKDYAPKNQASDGMVLNYCDSYPTITIVPSEANHNEVNYIVIVQQPGGENKSEQKDVKNGDRDQDLTVHDFEDNQDNKAAVELEAEDDKTKIIKLAPKKSKKVQAHQCDYCNYTSFRKYLLLRHIKKHSKEKPFNCNFCNGGFKTLASLKNHINIHTGTKPHHCKLCNTDFTTSSALSRHVQYKHSSIKPHKCHQCDYASVEKAKLKRHMMCHTGERPYQCPDCTYASVDEFKLKRHMRTHTGEKPYKCDICNARFTQSNSLKTHKLAHDVKNKPVFRCKQCPATCGRKTDLRIHVKQLHTSDRPIKCKICGRTFPDRYSCKLHTKTHEGEKCYKCELCSYASKSPRHLESHMYLHTGQKPFQCDACSKCFRQKQLLKRHCNLYHNPAYVRPKPQKKTHQCPECDKRFRHKGNLISHKAKHESDPSVQEPVQARKTRSATKKIVIINGMIPRLILKRVKHFAIALK